MLSWMQRLAFKIQLSLSFRQLRHTSETVGLTPLVHQHLCAKDPGFNLPETESKLMNSLEYHL